MEAAGVLLAFSKLILAHISGSGGNPPTPAFSRLTSDDVFWWPTTLSPVINENALMSSAWFTADFHSGHFNIIRYCNRPFANSQEMDEAICERVNACAKPNDTLYFLGDICLGGPDRVTAYRKRLLCRTIHFIEGNHDWTAREPQHLFASWNLRSEIHQQCRESCFAIMR